MTAKATTFLPAHEREALGPVLCDLMHGDPDLYRQLLERLIEANAEDLAQLVRAAAMKDWPAIRCHAHRLKGSGGLARCLTVVAAAGALEEAGRRELAAAAGSHIPHCVAVVTEFNEVLRLLLQSTGFNKRENSIHGMDVQCAPRTGTLSTCTGKTG